MLLRRLILLTALALLPAWAGAQASEFIQYSPPASGGNSRVLCSGRSLALTTSGTSKQTVATCTIPAGSFPTNYTTLTVRLFATHAANVNSTTTGVDFAGTGLIARISTASADIIAATATCEVASATTLSCHAIQSVSSGTTSGNIYGGTLTLTFTNDIPLTFHITTGTAAGDTTLNSYTVLLSKE